MNKQRATAWLFALLLSLPIFHYLSKAASSADKTAKTWNGYMVANNLKHAKLTPPDRSPATSSERLKTIHGINAAGLPNLPTITAAADTVVGTMLDSCIALVTIPDASLSAEVDPSTLQWMFSGSTQGFGSGQVATSAFNLGLTQIIYTATDSVGNIASDSMLVTVIDQTPPTIIAPSDIVAATDSNACSTKITVPDVTFTDLCSASFLGWTITGATQGNGSGQVAISTFNLGTSTIIFTATDSAGNNAADSMTVTVNDLIPPTIIAPSDIVTTTDSNACSATVIVPKTTVNDNCALMSLNWTCNGATQGTGNGEVGLFTFNLGTSTIIFTATDSAGNNAADSMTVTVNDLIPPTIIAPGDIVAATDSNACSATITVPDVTFADLCSASFLGWKITGATQGNGSGQVAISTFNLGTSTIIFTATDSAGNNAADSMTVTVNDLIPPTIIAPGDISAVADSNTCSAALTIPDVVFSDNCSSAFLEWIISGATEATGTGQVATSSFQVGQSTILFSAIDSEGNTSSDQTIITILDTIRPTLTVPADITASVDGNSCTATVTLPTVIVNDNCQNSTLFWSLTGATTGEGQGQPGSISLNTGTTYINFQVIDLDSNSANGQTQVTILDNQAPVLEVGPDLTINTSDGLCFAALNTPDVSVSDNCGSVTLSWSISGSGSGSGTGQVGLYSFPAGKTAITYTATDNSGNITIKVRNFTIIESEAPTITVPSDLTVQTDPGLCGTFLPLDAVTITDNCQLDTLYWVSTGVSSGNGASLSDTLFASKGVTTITFFATDLSGNSSSGSYQVTVTDSEVPQLTAPGDTLVNSDPDLCSKLLQLPEASFSDNCPGVFLSWQAVGSTNKSGTGQPGLIKFSTGTTLVIFTAIDSSGNNISDTTIVEVQDALPPKILVGPDTTLAGNAESCSATFYPPAITVADNCQVAGITWSLSGSTTGSGIGQPQSLVIQGGQTYLTYSVSDAAGNIARDSMLITVTDTTGPTLIPVSDLTIAANVGLCEGSLIIPMLDTMYDNCSLGAALVSWTLTGDSTATGIGFGDTLTLPVGSSYLTYSATDEAGNTGTASLEITIVDTEAPSLLASPDLTVNADPNLCSKFFEIPLATYSDNCQNVSLAWVATGATQISGTGQTGPIKFNVGTTELTFTATDEAGNTATDIVHVTVQDDLPPKISTGAPLQVSTDIGTCSAILKVPAVTATDNCQVGQISWVLTGATAGMGTGQVGDFPFNIGQTVITYTVYDVSGNSSSDTLLVTVVDSQAPVVNAGPDITAKNKIGQCQAILELPDVSVTDNCKDGSLVWQTFGATTANGIGQPGSVLFQCGITTVVFTATDNAGNTATDTLLVDLKDAEAPVIVAPVDVTIETDTGLCSATYSIPPIIFSDNCGTPTLSWKFNGSTVANGIGQPGTQTFEAGVTKIIYQVTDPSGNSSFRTASVTVIDQQKPIVTGSLPDQYIIGCGLTDIPKAVANYDELTLQFPFLQITDNCTLDKKTLLTHVDSIVGDCPVRVYRTYRIVDKGGNVATIPQQFELNDTLPPKATCQDIRIDLDSTGNGVVTAEDVNNNSLDNCGIASMQLDLTSFSCSDIGVNSVLLTVRDHCGNADTCTAKVNVIYELEASYKYTNISCNGDQDGSIQFIDPPGSTDTFEYSINGGLDWSVKGTFNNLDPGIYHLVFRLASDTLCTHTLTSNLSLTEPSPIKATITETDISCLNQADGTITFSNLTGGYPNYQYSIDQGVTWQSATLFKSLPAGTYYPVVKSIDNSGLVVCYQTFDSVDIHLSLNNLITECPKYLTVSGCGPEAISSSIQSNLTYSTDPVFISLASFKKEGGQVQNTCAASGLYYRDALLNPESIPLQVIRTFTLMAGNYPVDTCQQIILIEDKEAPTIQCSNTIVFLSDSSGNAILNAADLAFGSTDNCGSQSLEFAFDNNFTTNTLIVNCSEADLGVTHYKLYVRDANGNEASCKFGLLVKKTTEEACACDSDDQLDFNQGKGKKMRQGSFKAGKRISSNMEVATDSFVTLSAGDSVILYPGFFAKAGSQFKASVEACIPSTGLQNPPVTGLVIGNQELEEVKINQDNAGIRINSPEGTDTVLFLDPVDLQIFPNPIGSHASAWVSLPKPMHIELQIRQLSGVSVETLVSGQELQSGIHVFELKASEYPDGILVAVLVADNQVIMRKIIRTRP